MDDFQTASKLTLIPHQSSPHSSTIKKNQILIRIFFSLIILLALVTGAIIINLVHKYNVSQQKLKLDQQNESVRVFCSMTHHPDSCLASILIFTSVHENIRPDDIFNASLQIAIREVTDLTSLTRALILKSTHTESRNESALLRCSSLIDDSLNQLNRSLSSSAELSLFGPGVNPERETRVREEIRGMKPWVNDAWRDLWSCFGILGKEESTAAIELRSGVHNAIMYVSNIYDFLESRNDIVGEINFQHLIRRTHFGFGPDFKDLSTLVFLVPQYFVLILLFFLFFRIY